MEPSKGLEYKVGIFVIVAVFLTIGFVLALGGDKSLFQSFYALHMEADETGGLAVGSLVQISGIQAGHVDALSFKPENGKVDIRLKLEKRFLKIITKGSTAGLRTQGALGDKYVQLRPGPIGGEPINDNGQLDLEADSDLLSTLSRSGDKINRAFDSLDLLEHMVKSLHEKGFAQNLSETAKNMKSASSSLDEILLAIRGSDPKNNKLKNAADHLASILEKIDNGQGTLGGLINDPTVHEDMKTILGGAKRSKILKYLIRQTIEKGEEAEKKDKGDK